MGVLLTFWQKYWNLKLKKKQKKKEFWIRVLHSTPTTLKLTPPEKKKKKKWNSRGSGKRHQLTTTQYGPARGSHRQTVGRASYSPARWTRLWGFGTPKSLNPLGRKTLDIASESSPSPPILLARLPPPLLLTASSACSMSSPTIRSPLSRRRRLKSGNCSSIRG